MRHRKKSKKLGRSKSHRKALISNQAKQLFLRGRIVTTLTKAKIRSTLCSFDRTDYFATQFSDKMIARFANKKMTVWQIKLALDVMMRDYLDTLPSKTRPLEYKLINRHLPAITNELLR